MSDAPENKCAICKSRPMTLSGPRPMACAECAADDSCGCYKPAHHGHDATCPHGRVRPGPGYADDSGLPSAHVFLDRLCELAMDAYTRAEHERKRSGKAREVAFASFIRERMAQGAAVYAFAKEGADGRERADALKCALVIECARAHTELSLLVSSLRMDDEPRRAAIERAKRYLAGDKVE